MKGSANEKNIIRLRTHSTPVANRIKGVKLGRILAWRIIWVLNGSRAPFYSPDPLSGRTIFY